MAEAGFGVETIHLDLPPLAGALGQRLRAAGVPVTPERSAEFARALTLVRPNTPPAAVLDRPLGVRLRPVPRPGLRRGLPLGLRRRRGSPSAPSPATSGRLSERATAARDVRAARRARRAARVVVPRAAGDEPDGPEVEVPLALASDEERLAGKRFDALEPDELARLYRLMSRLELATPLRRTRRYERGAPRPADRHAPDAARAACAPAATRSGSRAGAGASVRRRLVMLCDISGSMEPYGRAYLQFLACAAGSGPHAEAFAFATRLTRLTRALASRHPERAIQRAAAAAPDWSSGTRIGDALKQFNDRHGRRGMARGAVVVILSDGWERGDPQLVGREMERLSRLAHRIVWVNPRVGASEFAVRAGGMVAALEHCDALVSGHSFEALGEVVDAIGAVSWREPPAFEAPPEEDAGALGQRDAGARQLGRDAQRLRPEQGQHDPGMGKR